SSNGTYLNKDRVLHKTVVRSGDKIQLGNLVFVAEYQRSSPSSQHDDLVDDEVDVQRVVDDDVEEDVEVVDDGMPPFARSLEQPEKEDITKPIPVDSDESIAPPVKAKDTTPRPKPKLPARRTPEPQQEQVPLPEPGVEGDK